MIYTFQKRKELNAMTVERYPDTVFERQSDGVPRMVCRKLPSVVEEVGSIGWLEDNAYRYWKLTRKQLPVFIAIRATDKMAKHYDVNYVSHLSGNSLNMAAMYISERRLFTEPITDSAMNL